MKVNAMQIWGNWDLGFVLDWHMETCQFLGYDQFGRADFDPRRTEIGEAIFQLKYRHDLSQIESLAETFVSCLQSAFRTAAFIVPVPPSKYRRIQPVLELSRKVAERNAIPLFENVLLRCYEKVGKIFVAAFSRTRK